MTRRSLSIDWDAHLPGQPGIPVQNHDWKGDEILAGSMPLPEGEGDWLPRAVLDLRDRVIGDRKRYGYRPRVPTS